MPWAPGVEGSVTLVTRALGLVNIVAFALTLILMGFVLLSRMLDTAQDGVPLGRDVDTLWTPIRNGLAMVLLVPVGGIGGGTASIAQAVVIWMLIWGSSAASLLWDAAVGLLGPERSSRGSRPTRTWDRPRWPAREIWWRSSPVPAVWRACAAACAVTRPSFDRLCWGTKISFGRSWTAS